MSIKKLKSLWVALKTEFHLFAARIAPYVLNCKQAGALVAEIPQRIPWGKIVLSLPAAEDSATVPVQIVP